MTRYKVELEIAIKDGEEESGQRGFQHLLGRGVPARDDFAVTRRPMFTKVETTLLGSTPVDPRWKAILDKVDEIAADGVHLMSSRGTAMEGQRGELSCIAKYYRRVGKQERSDERYVYVIVCEPIRNDDAYYVKVEGPYVDSGDAYWQEMAERDKAQGDALITDKWDHYTVHKDSKVPGQGDGFGGSEFRFLLYSRAKAADLKDRGFKVEACDDGTLILVTRNLWSQSRIPAAHRHLFVRNCQDLGAAKDIKPLDLEAGLFPKEG